MGSEQDSGHLSVWGSLEQDCSGLCCLLKEALEAARYGLRELKTGFEPSFDCHNAHSLGGRLGAQRMKQGYCCLLQKAECDR